MTNPTIHASAVLVGRHAVLILGPSGSGKSRLVWDLLQAAQQGVLPFAMLVADDRAHVEAVHGRLLVRPAAALAGLLEIRGSGIQAMPHEAVAIVALVIELGRLVAERLPESESLWTTIHQIRLPRLAVAAGDDPLRLALAHLQLTRRER